MSNESSKRKRKKKKCPHCSSGPEVYRYLKRQYVFDVDHARRLIGDGRQPVEVDPDCVRETVDETRIYPQHLEHVDTQYPGIIAYVFAYLPNCEEVEGHLLIDGNHRAARCLELGQPFYAHVLTREESRKIILKAPKPKFAETPREVACPA